ncbi:MAG: hypothetical protein HOP30_20065 [Cyclobacteriaceae bacterium]|nr:hypothetical protein [Cyclobacteriaceae bacterium]
MAKTIAKPTTEKPAAKKAAPKRAATTKAVDVAKIATSILEKLKSLSIEPTLQAEIEWCLGSYAYDQNPVGLIEATKKSLVVFQSELAKKTKGVTAKFIAEIEKAANA